jgi:hypothetical protein
MMTLSEISPFHKPFRLSLERHFCSTAEARTSSLGAEVLLGDGLESVISPFSVFSSHAFEGDLG